MIASDPRYCETRVQISKKVTVSRSLPTE